MVIESESKSKRGGYRDGAGRLKMYQDYPNTEQKRLTIPVEFLEKIRSEYGGEHGRNWASVGVYDILKQWYEQKNEADV